MRVYQLSDDDNIIARDTQVWMGIDVHSDKADVVILDADEMLFHETIPMGEQHFASLVERLPECTVFATYEAGSIGYKPLRWLREAGCDRAFMTAPSMVPDRSGDRVKTDRRDALKLARCLRGQMLDPVYDLSDTAYEHRQLTRTRKQLVEHRTGIRQQIKAMLEFHGIEVPEGISPQWSNAFIGWLAEAPTGRPMIDVALAALVTIDRYLSRQIERLTDKLEELANTERYADRVELLRTIPGVGLVVAMTFLLELPGLVERFDTCDELASYLGLTPSQSTSNGRGSRGSLTKTGNAHVRSALVQASWQLIGHDDQMREVYDRIKAKNAEGGAGIAIVAVARRLALAMRAMLRDGEPYDRPAG